MKSLGLAAVLAAVCGLLVAAPAALAKNVHYEGPVDQPIVGPYQEPPRIEFAVRYSKNKKGKVVPKSVPKLDAWNLWYQCEHPVPGVPDSGTIFHPNAIDDSKSQVIVGVEFPVKHRKFSTASSDNGVVIEVSGTLKGKQASGTVRLSESTEPGSGFDVGYCDSGPLSWTASG
jgi:hypothetical protein